MHEVAKILMIELITAFICFEVSENFIKMNKKDKCVLTDKQNFSPIPCDRQQNCSPSQTPLLKITNKPESTSLKPAIQAQPQLTVTATSQSQKRQQKQQQIRE